MRKLRGLSCQSTFIITFLLFSFANTAKSPAEENQLKDVIKHVMPATVLVVTYDASGQPLSQGSGFFVSEKGEVITNYHVMNGAEKASIKMPDGSICKITDIIAEDLAADLIKMQADTGNNKVSFLSINKAAPEVGDKVVIIGSPQGLENTVSDGIVSAVRDVPGFGSIIQTTAPISPGSSGSPVVNMEGEVVGVASAQIREGQNLNFVVPAAKIIELKEKKQVVAISTKDKTKIQATDILSTAMFYYINNDYEKALPLFNQYLQTYPDSDEGLFYAGLCYANLGRYQEAIQAFKQVIRLKPDYYEAHCNLGAAYDNSGLPREAIQAYKAAIRLKPDDAEAHCNLGFAYVNLGRYQEAIQAFKQAIRLKPDLAEAHSSMGIAYANLGRYQEAIQAFKQAIMLKPDYADAHNNLGAAYSNLRRPQEALQAFKQAIRLKPDDAMVHRNLGIVYLAINDTGSALEEYKILKNLDAELANELFNKIYN
jgi:tetratricopeptide (TPR) repeat protein